MAHNVTGVLLRSKALKSLQKPLSAFTDYELNCGISMIPIDRQDFRDILGCEVYDLTQPDGTLSQNAIGFLKEQSRGSEFAWIETEYFGGSGLQASVLFRDCEIIVGFRVQDDMSPVDVARVAPINDVLSHLGVKAIEGERDGWKWTCDAFAQVGLEDFRSNEDFANGPFCEASESDEN